MMQRLLQSGARRLQNAVMADCGELSPALAQFSWTPVSAGARDPKIHAGIYQAGNRFLAVNRPAIEDAPERLDPARATALFAGLPAQFWQETSNRSDRLQGEIWRLFLFGMILFLLVEGWLILPQGLRADSEPARAKQKPKPEMAVAS